MLNRNDEFITKKVELHRMRPCPGPEIHSSNKIKVYLILQQILK